MLTVSHPALKEALSNYYRLTAGQLQGQESERKDIMRRLTMHLGIASLVFAGLTAWSFLKFGIDMPTPLIVVAGVLYVSFFYKKATRSLNAEAKSTLITGLVDSLNWSFQSEISDFAALHLFQKNHLVPRRYDRIHFEDEIRGKVRTHGFIATECHMQNRNSDSKGRTNWVTTFRGSLIEIDFRRKFKGRTLVLRDKGFFNSKKKSGLSRIGLVDPVFEKAFEAYGSDQVEGRYLLTPDFMQKLVDLEGSVDGKRIRFAFTGAKLLIAIETPNRYEIGSMFKPINDERRIQRFFDEFAALYHIIDSVADNPRFKSA